jgi:hypothetical protein
MIEATEAPGAAAPGPAGETPQPPIPAITLGADAPESFPDPRPAARALSQRRWALHKERHGSAAQEQPQAATTETQLQQNEDGAPVETQPSAEHTTEATPDPEADPGSSPGQELPPIEPPRSWTKEERQRFQSLPRETQEYLSVREQERDREVRRSQNEAAESRKAVEAERKTLGEAKQQYEQALAPLLKALEAANAGEFGDIKTYDDAEKLARENPARYAQYAARQQKLALIAQEAKAAEERQRAEQTKAWNAYAAQQDRALLDRVPELAKPESRAALTKLGLDYLVHRGFTVEEASALHHATILRDARIQEIILDGARRWDAQNKLKAAPRNSAPPPQRPGVSQPRVDVLQARIDSLTQQLEGATGQKAIKIAAELRTARLKQANADADRARTGKKLDHGSRYQCPRHL